MKISYDTVDAFPGWGRADRFLLRLIGQTGARSVLEIGAGANPTLAPDEVERRGLAYTTNDADENELGKAPPGYERLVVDFARGELPVRLEASYDLIFSRMVNEHVRGGEMYHRNLFRALKRGGTAAHCFSTLYALPFVLNRLLPESLNRRLLTRFASRDQNTHGKFKAYYSWSRGPSRRMIRRFESLGYEVVEFAGFFGHHYYSSRLPLLHRIEMLKSRWLGSRLRVPLLTSYAYVVLRKPE